MTAPTRIAAYLRVSTGEQAAEGMSLPAQEARIRAWADAVGAEVVEVITDAGVSGTLPLADRTNGRRVAEMLASRRPPVDAVAVLRLDRLGRDAAETLALLKAFRNGRLGLVSLAERVDLATPHGRAMAGVAAVFAELERNLIAERTREALAERRRQGRPFSHAPFGWEAVDGRLRPVLGEQDVLSRIRALRAAGRSYAAVAATLRDEGVPTKRGGRWEAATVHSVLKAQDGLPDPDGSQ